MVPFFEYPGLTNREAQMIKLPSGPLQLPQRTTYTLMGVYDASTNEVNNLRIAHGVSREGDTTSNTAYKEWSKCMRKDCTFRMMSMQNADQVAVFTKGEHNHVVRPNPWRPKPINDPATIDATIDEVLERVRRADENDANTVINTPSNVENVAANAPLPPKTPRKPITRGMGKRQKKKPPAKKWNIRTPFDNFEALVSHLMAHGATPHGRPCFKKGKISRIYRCRKCSYIALGRRRENPSEKCVLFETREHRHKTAKVPSELLHLYLEVPDPLPRRLPPGTVIVIDSDDEHSIHEADDGNEANKDVVDIAQTANDHAESHVFDFDEKGEAEDDANANALTAIDHAESHVSDSNEECLADEAAVDCEAAEDCGAKNAAIDNASAAVDQPDLQVTVKSVAADDGEFNEKVMGHAPAASDHLYSHVAVETAAVRVKAPLVDYPDSDDSDVDGRNEGDDAMEVDAPSDDTPKAPDGKGSQTTDKAAAVNSGDAEATATGPNGSVVKDDTANEERIITAIDALCQLFQHRAKIASLDAAQEARHTTEGHQNTVNADSDPVRKVFPEVDPTFKGYEDLKKMIYKDIPDAPKPPRRRKQARPMKVECIPAHGALSVWMARLRRLQDAVDEFVEQTREERKQRRVASTHS